MAGSCVIPLFPVLSMSFVVSSIHSGEGLGQNSLFTTGENIQNGIVSINRYDWGLWQTEGMVNKHGKEPKNPYPISSESNEWDEEEIEALCKSGHALIDYKDCQQEKWSKALSGMHTDDEHDYGRVGFKEGEAKSFLLFDRHPFDELYFRQGVNEASWRTIET